MRHVFSFKIRIWVLIYKNNSNSRSVTNNIRSSDKKTEELFTYLLTKASQPYFDMLTLWIYNGVVRDPYCEFCVKQNPIKTNESHFNDAYVPYFLLW